MRIAYFADGGWGLLCLERLLADGEAIAAVVLRRASTDLRLRELARERSIPCLAPSDANDPSFVARLRALGPDLGISMSYDQILGRLLLGVPRLGFLNCHAGRLPAYRGRNVLNWALINGEREIGLTVHFMDEGIDTGPILLEQTLPVAWEDDYSSLLARAERAFPDLLATAVQSLAEGAAVPRPQVGAGTYYRRRRLGDEWIDWRAPGCDVYNLIRGIAPPGPGARTLLDGCEVAVLRAACDPSGSEIRAAPGEVVRISPEGIFVQAGDSVVLLREVRMEGRRPRPVPGTRFTSPAARRTGTAPRIPVAAPLLTPEDCASVARCLGSGWVSTAGPLVNEFEAQLGVSLGVPAERVVATINGTAALHTSLRLLGAGPGSLVLVPALTFAATANAVAYLGATPAFLDVDERGGLEPASLRAFLASECHRQGSRLLHRRTGLEVACLVVVHALGHPADLEPLTAIAAEHSLPVLEDAAGALGSRHGETPVGTAGTIGIFSFNGNKVVTAGAGGAMVIRDPGLAARARHLIAQARRDAIDQVHDQVGYNYRLTNLHAALGLSQLRRLATAVTAKRRIAAAYTEALADLPGLAPILEPERCASNYWLYTVRVRADRFGRSARELLGHLAARGIETRRLWQPLHRSPAYHPALHGPVERADLLYDEALSLPCSVGLGPEQQQEVILALREIHHGG